MAAARKSIIGGEGMLKEFPLKGGSAMSATHYCAGCGHGTLHKLIAEAMADMGLEDRTILLSPVGCAVFAYYYLDCGHIQCAHGRAPAVGSAVTRVAPNSIVVSYQGDGDLVSIGFNETFHAANRGEKMAVFFVNNAIYGMTGGQMAPTTLAGQKTASSPFGRDPVTEGYPVHVCEVLNELEAPVYIERCSLGDAKRVMQARRAVRKAMEIQRDGKGFAFVEFLSPCPTNIGKTSEAADEFVCTTLENEFELKCFRDRSKDAESIIRPLPAFGREDLDRIFEDLGVAAEQSLDDPDFVPRRVKLAGFGGHGVMSLGVMLANAAKNDRRYVTWYPSYGPEQRGGTANCAVVISGVEIGNPVVSAIDCLVAMNQPALEKFAPDVSAGGVIVCAETTDPSGLKLAEGVRVIQAPVFDIAARLGLPQAANTAMLGVLCASGVTGLGAEAFEGIMKETFQFKPKLIEPNEKVFQAAVEFSVSRNGMVQSS